MEELILKDQYGVITEQTTSLMDWIKVAEHLWYLKKRIREFEAEAKITMAQLQQMSNYQEGRGGGFIFNYSERKGSIEYGAIPELKNVNLELYRKEPVKVWTLEKE
jgi:hypothetical protein